MPARFCGAYRDLQARGLIESRPRSGLLRAPIVPRRVPEPAATAPTPGPKRIIVGDLIVDRLRGEPPAGVADVHTHPLEPLAARLTVSKSF